MNFTPTPVQIVDVLEARYTVDGRIDALVTIEGPELAVRNAAGDNESMRTNGILFRCDLLFTWNPDEDYDNSWNLTEWFYLNPEFEVLPYVPPEEPVKTPEDTPLTKRQLRLGLVANGKSVTFVQDVIDSIQDPAAKAVAQIEWDEAQMVNWAHPVTQQLMAATGMNDETIRTMWMNAAAL